MGFPTVAGAASGDRNPCLIEIREEVSGVRLFELELTAQQLLDLLARRGVTPEVTFAYPHPERAGHEQIRWTESFPAGDETGAVAFRNALVSRGWHCGDIGRTNSQEHKFIVTGRRWDGVQPGTWCREHRYLAHSADPGCVICANAHLRENGGTK
jgi:hypothetical protein